jgi:hypothetical protein
LLLGKIAANRLPPVPPRRSIEAKIFAREAAEGVDEVLESARIEFSLASIYGAECGGLAFKSRR